MTLNESRGNRVVGTHVALPQSNEDAFLALALDGFQVQYLGKVGNAPLEDHDYIFAVSDGMGGANAGEFASRIAVEKLTYLFPHKREPRTDEECQSSEATFQ